MTDFYPEATPAADLIESPPPYGSGGSGDWWERHAERPAPEACPGDDIGGRRAHPTSGTWCQFCGWHETPPPAPMSHDEVIAREEAPLG